MTRIENRALKKTQKYGKIAQSSYQKSILSHLNILDLEEENDALDEYDC